MSNENKVVLPEPFAWLIERSAFRVSPHGQDAESNEWLEEAHEPGQEGFLYVKKVWAKKSPVGKNMCTLKGDYYMTSIYGVWYKSHRLIYLLLNKNLFSRNMFSSSTHY